MGSDPVVVLLGLGIAVVIWVLYVVVCGEWGGEDVEFPDSVEHDHLKRVAEARISALARGAIRLAEKERLGDVESCRDSAPAREFWRRFAAASASVEREPIAALRELRGLPGLLEEALRGVERETCMAKVVSRKEGGR